MRRNFDEKFAVLKRGPHYAKGHRYNTVKDALEDGAVVMAYGYVLSILISKSCVAEEEKGFNGEGRSFVNNVIQFFVLGLSLYSIALIYTSISHDTIIKHTVKCKYCRKSISEKVSVSSDQDQLPGRSGPRLTFLPGKALRELYELARW